MKKLSDERLEQMLSAYCEADPQQTFTFHPKAPFPKGAGADARVEHLRVSDDCSSEASNRKKTGKKLIAFIGFNRAAAAAASLVLVGVLSLTVYFLFGNNNSTPFAVAPSPQSVTTPSTPTGESDSDPLQQTDSIFILPTEKKLQPSDDSIQSPTTLIEENEQSNGSTDTPSPRKITPTENPQSNLPTTTKGTPSSTEDALQPTEPVEPSCVKPTVYIDPFYLPNGEAPGDPPGDEPGAEPSPYDSGTVIRCSFTGVAAMIDDRQLKESNSYYCMIADGNGNPLGSMDKYDSSHLAVFADYKLDDKWLIAYDIPINLISKTDVYGFMFYNDKGQVLAKAWLHWEW